MFKPILIDETVCWFAKEEATWLGFPLLLTSIECQRPVNMVKMANLKSFYDCDGGHTILHAWPIIALQAGALCLMYKHHARASDEPWLVQEAD